MADNYSLIEGDFKNLYIRRITPGDYDNVCEHITKYFLHGELTSKTLGVTDDYAKEFAEVTQAVLKQNYSFLAEDKDTKEVAGLRLTFVEKQNENIFKDIKIETRQNQIILSMFAQLDVIANVFETYDVNSYVFFFVASTSPNFQNNGVARELYARSLRFLKAEGHKICKVFTSSPYSGAATKTVGFKEVGRIHFEELKDADGNPAFAPSQLTPQHCALVKVLSLDDLQV